MGKNLKRFVLALCVVMLCVSMIGVTAYAAYSIEANIPVQITLSGTEPAAPETFVVEVTAADPAFPMPAGTEGGVYKMAMEGASSDTIDIVYNKVGVYEYTVKQIPGDNGDCRYDDAVYHVTAFVTNNEDYSGYDLSVVVYRNEETEKGDIVFENVYANPDEVEITAVKTLDGNAPEDGAFTFELLDSTGKLLQTAKNVGKDVTFAPISYYKVGTYEYQLKEVEGSNEKIIYDKVVYNVSVEVVKDENGDYKATLTYEKGEDAYTGTPVFANKTKTDSPSTGDDFQMTLWIGLAAVSLLGIVALVVLSRKNGKKEEEPKTEETTEE